MARLKPRCLHFLCFWTDAGTSLGPLTSSPYANKRKRVGDEGEEPVAAADDDAYDDLPELGKVTTPLAEQERSLDETSDMLTTAPVSVFDNAMPVSDAGELFAVSDTSDMIYSGAGASEDSCDAAMGGDAEEEGKLRMQAPRTQGRQGDARGQRDAQCRGGRSRGMPASSLVRLVQSGALHYGEVLEYRDGEVVVISGTHLPGAILLDAQMRFFVAPLAD